MTHKTALMEKMPGDREMTHQRKMRMMSSHQILTIVCSSYSLAIALAFGILATRSMRQVSSEAQT
jgi:hypothetical protein